MAGGIPAGRLSIEIVAEVARLQADMDKVKRAVRDASGDIARNAKAANDNLASIGRGASSGLKQFSQEAQRANEYLRKIAQTSSDVVTRVNAVTGVTGGMRRSADDFAAYGKELDRLRAQYNPLFAVIQKYRASVEDIRKAHSVGAISAEEMAQAVSRERQVSLESIASLKGRTTAMKEAEQAAREAAKAEELAARQREAASASATSYASRLEAEAAAIGKTAAQLRAMEVEQRAAAAAAAGLGAEADRIRAAGAAYAEAAAKAEQEAAATRDAAAAHDAFEQRVREGVIALREREALVASADNYAAKIQAQAAAVGKTATELRDLEIAQRAANAAAEGMPDQADKIRAAGAALTEAEARARAYAEEQKRVADATKAAADAEAEYAKSIEDLKKQADPAGTAQAQLNTQMELAEKAFREGRLAADDYAKIIHNLQTRVNLLNTDGFGPLGHGGQVAGHHMLNLSFQMQDLGIQMLGAAQSSAPLKLAFTALAQQGSQIYGIIQQSGLGFKGFAVQALTAAGIIKVAGDEALIAAARQAAAHEAVVASLAERAVANAATAEAEVALARVQVANATTAGEAAAAHTRLAAAEARSAAAAAESATAQGALTAAQTSSATATQAASASMVTRLGTVGAALVPVAAALAAGAAGFALYDRAVSKGIDTKKMIDGLGLTRAEIKKLENTSITSGDVIKATFQVMVQKVGVNLTGLGKGWSKFLDWMTDIGRKAMAGLYANTVGTFQAMVQAVKALGSGKGFTGALAAAGKAYRDAYEGANKELTKFGKEVSKQLRDNKLKDWQKQAAALKAERTPKSDRAGESLARELEATEALIKGLYRSADAYGVSTAAGIRARVEAEAIAKGIKKQADVQDYASLQLRKYVAEQVVGSAEQVAALNDQTRAQQFVNQAIRNGSLDADKASEALAEMAEQQKLTTTMAVAAMNNDAEGYKAAKKALKDLTEAQLANKKARKETEDAIQSAQIGRAIEDIRTETKLTSDLGAARLKALRGLSGDALEDELARIALEQEKVAIQVRAETEARRLRDAGLTKSADLKMAEAQAAKDQADARFEIEKQTVAIERYNDRLQDTIDLLGDLGSVGQGLGALLGVLSGNTTGLRGPLGDLLNLGMTGKDDKGKDVASSIGEEMSKIFKKDGAFVKAVVPALQNAATGMAASSALFGKQSATEQAGSAIGGALGGSKVVEKVLSKGLESLSAGLGQFAGPLGSVLGGVLGSALGGAFTKVKWGRVDLSAAGVSGTSGNSGSSQKAALAAGNSIYGGLADLAAQFGGSIGNFGNISVGVRHGDYRVNAGGTSLKVKKGAVDFNDDAEAAVAYAMKLAIERGAINGIRASTNNLLKAGDDLSAQIDKALSFENVFTELKTYLDPVGAELDTVEKEFANLRSIFAEAGATAAEYAQLEQLLSIKRQEAMNKETDALNDIRSRIAEASGDEATVTAIARAKELRDATSDAQRALLQQLYALEDANAAQDKLTAAQEAAATAAEQLRQAWESTSNSLIDEVNRIRGLTGGDDAASFATLQGQFNAAVLAARGGDQEAAAKLADLSQSLLDVAGNVATSRQEMERIKAETAASLEGVIDVAKGYAGGSTSASSASATPSSAIDAASTATGGTSSANSSNDNGAELRAIRAELAQLRADVNNGQAAIASGVNRSARVLEDTSAESGGVAFAVSGVAK